MEHESEPAFGAPWPCECPIMPFTMMMWNTPQNVATLDFPSVLWTPGLRIRDLENKICGMEITSDINRHFPAQSHQEPTVLSWAEQ